MMPAPVATTARVTRSKSSPGQSARAASCTSTVSTSGSSAASPAATESWRVAPPATTIASGAIRCACFRCVLGATITTCAGSIDWCTPSSARSSIVRPRTSANAFGTPAPSRLPAPAATTMTPTFGIPSA